MRPPLTPLCLLLLLLGCAGAKRIEPDLTAGRFHTCSLDRTGAAHCWGSNHAGELGHGQAGARLRPTRVATEARFVDLSASELSTCGLDTEGVAWCWGVRQGGESLRDRVSVPTRVEAPQPFVQVSSSTGVACGLDKRGGLWCWGGRSDGRLGMPLEGRTERAVRVQAPRLVEVQVGASTTCGRARDGSVYCWGKTGQATLGDGRERERTAVPDPQQVVLPGPVASLSESDAWTWCALLEDGSTWCWGDASGGMFPGKAGSRSLHTPAKAELPPMQQVSIGFSMACGTTVEGEARCWGSDRTFSSPKWGGALGRGEVLTARSGDPVFAPAPVQTDLRFDQVVAAEDHACARTRDGAVWCWGHDAIGQLGRGIHDAGPWPEARPVRTRVGVELTTVEIRDSITCGTDVRQRTWCWPTLPMLRAELEMPGPVLLAETPDAKVSLSRRTACAIAADGSLSCVEADYSRRRRRWTLETWGVQDVQASALRVGRPDVCAAEVGTERMRCWNRTRSGEVVEADAPSETWTEPRPKPRRSYCELDEAGVVRCFDRKGVSTGPEGLTGTYTAVTAAGFGSDTRCARRDDGVVSCWGRNSQGALGRATDVHENEVPRPIDGPAMAAIQGVSADLIAGTDAVTWGVDAEGTVYGWGCGRPEARVVPGAPSVRRFLEVRALGWFGGCGLTESGDIACWQMPEDLVCGEGQPTPVRVELPR